MHPNVSRLIQALHAYAKEHGKKTFVMGLSGGLDSAFVLYVAVRAFGAKNVKVLLLPEHGVTPPYEVEQAQKLCDYFQVAFHYVNIHNFLVDYQFLPWKNSLEQEKHRKAKVRAMLLQDFAQSQEKALWVSCANQSDIRLGLGDIYGLFAGDLMVLGDFFKTEIVEMALSIQLPQALFQQAMGMYSYPGHSDEMEFGASALEVDALLKTMDDGGDPIYLVSDSFPLAQLQELQRRIFEAQGHSTAPVLKVKSVQEKLLKARAFESKS